MSGRQPEDGWTFLQPERFGDDEELHKLQHLAGRDPETAAVHLERSHMPLDDPGLADVSTAAYDDAGGATYFDDEEPESNSLDGSVHDTDMEPDLEEILESQHYAFGRDDQDDRGDRDDR